MKKTEKKVVDTEKKPIKHINIKKILLIIKFILFITMIILTYFISDKFIDYITTLETEVLKRVLNLILAIAVSIIYMKGGKKNG